MIKSLAHPGEILLAEFLQSLEVSQCQFAAAVNVPAGGLARSSAGSAASRWLALQLVIGASMAGGSVRWCVWGGRR
jgi:plasmid maintenance system antidote protein VapI